MLTQKEWSKRYEKEFIKSDYCSECGGEGFVVLRHENPLADSEKEQCETCEELHRTEILADIMQDIEKGN